MLCDVSFGRGITFTPTTYSSGGAAGIAEGPVAYRSRNKQVIVAIPGRQPCEPDALRDRPARIALCRSATAAHWCGSVRLQPMPRRTRRLRRATRARRTASPSAPPSAGSLPQVAAVDPSPPRSTLSRPSPEVCRNTLLDKLGTSASTRCGRCRTCASRNPLSKARCRTRTTCASTCAAARATTRVSKRRSTTSTRTKCCSRSRSSGTVRPGRRRHRSSRSACTTLSRVNPWRPASAAIIGTPASGHIMGRLILQDLPERNLLLEAYKAKK